MLDKGSGEDYKVVQRVGEHSIREGDFMPFPDKGRVKYTLNPPLKRVICQIRFPPILGIEANPPAAFQEQISRKAYPNLQESVQVVFEPPLLVEGTLSPELLQAMTKRAPPPLAKSYAFSAENGDWQVTLTRTFLSLTTKKYEIWNEFSERLSVPLKALIENYAPSYFTRIGLRYIDSIKRSTYGLGEVEWAELVHPALAGALADIDTSKAMQQLSSISVLQLEKYNAQLAMRVQLQPAPSAIDSILNIDSDFFVLGRMEMAGVLERLEFLHTRSSRFIRWALKPKLEEAMKPEPI